MKRNFRKILLQKKLQKDLNQCRQKEASSDLTHLQKRLKTRTTGRRNFIYYRIAASVAVLMVISTIYFLVERDKTGKHLTDIAPKTEQMEIAENKPIREPAVKDKVSEKSASLAEKRSVKSAEIQIRTETSKEAGNAEELKIETAPVKDTIPEIKVKAAEGYAAARQVAAPLAVMTKEKNSSGIRAKGQVFSSEDNMPVPGANVFIKGTNNGVVTDAGGNFNITIPDSDRRILVANFIGMKSKEFEVKPDTQLRVRLDPSVSALSEVVVIGYGSVQS